MILPVFRFHLPHLFWFLFGCSVLWKVGRQKPDPVHEQIRVSSTVQERLGGYPGVIPRK